MHWNSHIPKLHVKIFSGQSSQTPVLSGAVTALRTPFGPLFKPNQTTSKDLNTISIPIHLHNFWKRSILRTTVTRIKGFHKPISLYCSNHSKPKITMFVDRCSRTRLCRWWWWPRVSRWRKRRLIQGIVDVTRSTKWFVSAVVMLLVLSAWDLVIRPHCRDGWWHRFHGDCICFIRSAVNKHNVS